MHLRLLLPLLLLPFSSAIIPRPCASNVTETPAICCPTPRSFKNPCGFPHRGRCALVTQPKSSAANIFAQAVKEDLRMGWPARVFQYLCSCANNFWGVACEGCRFGFEGATCQHRVTHVRRNVMSYSRLEKYMFTAILDAAHHVDSGFVRPDGLGDRGKVKFVPMSIYQNAVYTHYFAASYPHATQKKLCASKNLNHNSATFILWHRYIIMWWERQMRDMARKKFGWHNFTLPYWDYTDKDTCEVCTSDFICNISDRRDQQIAKSCKPIADWVPYCTDDTDCNRCNNPAKRRLKREFDWKRENGGKVRLITAKEIAMALAAPVFYVNPSLKLGSSCTNFATYIEVGCKCLKERKQMQMHNLVHDIFGGDMQGLVTSPNDPLFFMHHTQLDRLLQRWILHAKPTASQIPQLTKKPQVCRWCNLVGFLPVTTGAEMLRDVRQMGLDYDSLDFGPLKANETVPLAKSPKKYAAMMCDRV